MFRRFQAGDAIVRQGDEGQKLFVVLNGVANVYKNMEQDAEVAADVWKVSRGTLNPKHVDHTRPSSLFAPVTCMRGVRTQAQKL